jgi:hypothetical protein
MTDADEFSALLAAKTSARDAMVAYELDQNNADRYKVSESCRNWWRSVEELLQAMKRPVRYGEPLSNDPLAFLTIMKNHAAELADGAIPRTVIGVKMDNRVARRSHRLWRQTAATYFLAAKPGKIEMGGQSIKIDDPAPGKTIADLYGCDASLANKWAKQEDLRDCPVPDDETILRSRLADHGAKYRALQKARPFPRFDDA